MEAKEILLETGTNEFEILEFFISEKQPKNDAVMRNYFGINVAKVMEVIESPELKPKDYAVNPCFLGTIPLRGMALPVIDLSVCLGMDRKKHEHENIIVTQFSNSIQGFVVSGVVEIHRLTWKELIPPGEFIKMMETKSIIGMVDREKYFIQILDLEYIIADLNPESIEEVWKTSVKADVRHRTLIVDDSPIIRKMLLKNLTASNFEVKALNNGDEALRYLSGLKKQAEAKNTKITDLVNVIISDIEMPLLDGFTLTKSVKEDPVLKNIPVILYSSIITEALRHKGESVKADYQVSKPDMNKIAEVAIQLINRN